MINKSSNNEEKKLVIEAARSSLKQLGSLTEKSLKRTSLLKDLSEDIQFARSNGASYKMISEAMRQVGIKTNRLEVAQFCRTELGEKTRRWRRQSKTKSEGAQNLESKDKGHGKSLNVKIKPSPPSFETKARSSTFQNKQEFSASADPRQKASKPGFRVATDDL
jgi:hypothetical protein